MNYLKFTFSPIDSFIQEEIIALLSDEPVSGFEQKPDQLDVYAEANEQIANTIKELARKYCLSISMAELKEENWNKKWEENFEPVVLPGFCAVRAHFHPEIKDVIYDILITPKMSFGTGHHATTRMMLLLMKTIDFSEKTVFDFGMGTGILSILAAKLGAKSIVGVDIDHWSYENSIENAALNHTSNFEPKLGGIELATEQYDIILANINRNILLENMANMFSKLNAGGYALMSGILKEQDEKIIQKAAINAGFSLSESISEGEWCALLFYKS